jgi:uncharacterized glyoxalase superfamily protein PhnB
MPTNAPVSARSGIASAIIRCEPRLAYDEPATAAAFLASAFDLHEQARHEGPGESLMAWLAFGESTLMIGRSGPDAHNLWSPRATSKPTAELNVIVDDIEAHYHRATFAGAAIVSPLEDMPWGLRRYQAVDCEGHGWHFMKPLPDIRDGKATPERLELRLFYADELAALEFLSAALGLEERARLDNPDGTISVWLGCGESALMISRASSAAGRHSPQETGKPTAMLNVHVDAIDAHHQRAVAAGARIVTELEDTLWGIRRYEVLDAEGHRWHVMQERY